MQQEIVNLKKSLPFQSGKYTMAFKSASTKDSQMLTFVNQLDKTVTLSLTFSSMQAFYGMGTVGKNFTVMPYVNGT